MSVVSLALIHPACGRGLARGEARERAYRANNLGVAQLEQFKYVEAAAAFREALQRDSSLAIARVNLSLALLYAQDLAGAAREATEGARLLPSAPQPPYILGLIARTESRTSDALREFERVHQIDGADVGASINLGQIYLEERRYPQAIAVLRPAAEVEPYNVTVAYNLGLALTRSGQVDEGLRMLERAQALRSTGYAVTYGTGYLEQGRYAEAIASKGAEPDLVDTSVPSAAFTPAEIGPPADRSRVVASPFGRRFSAGDLTPSGARQIAAGLGGCVTLADVDNDGDLDLFDASAGQQRLFRNDGQGIWTDVTSASGLIAPADAVPIGCVAGDYDNDGRTDLFVLRYGVSSLYHNDGGGRFSDVTTSAGIAPYPFLPGAAAFVDVDHDGDLDLVIAGLADLDATVPRAAERALTFPGEFAPAPMRLLRNNRTGGNGTFTDTTAEARLQIATHAIAIVPTDFDNRRDIDLLVVNRGGPPVLLQNLRDGTFRDVAADVGLAAAVGAEEVTSVTAADVNKDDFPDFFFGRPGDGVGGVFALSDGHGRFRAGPAPDGVRAGLAAQFIDYDNDGLLDLLTWSEDGPQVFRNLGQRWSDVSTSAMPRAPGRQALSSARGLVLGDLNADGRTDLVTRGEAALTLWRNNGRDNRRSLRVELTGRASNRLGVGSKIQMRAGSLMTRLERSAASPPVAPADIVFGLGSRPGADAVRVFWPSGILQTEARESALPSPLAPLVPLVIVELDRKPSSCPFLYTWNGTRFEFVTDFMGGGEMGYWEGPAKRNTPDPLEYVRIRADQLRAKDGRFEIRVTNELEETLFADRFQLLAIAHPRDIEVYPNEGMTESPKPYRLFAVKDERVPHAVDAGGRDVTEQVARIDRRYPDSFALARFRGYAAPHTLMLDLEPVGRAPVLLLTAWTDYAFSSDNLAAHQAGLSLTPPFLQARDAAGRWRTIVGDIGIPVGRPQTVTVDLAGRLRPGEHEVRIVTNMRIYWDRVLVATAVSNDDVQIRPLDPIAATLRARGFSAEIRPNGQEPSLYDYARVTLASPWKTMPGRYTREGDVRELLMKTDDMFVVAKPGDEIAIAFDAASAGPLPDGWTRTFLLLADGFSKEMDINSASPDGVEPLPFHAMSAYPYRAPEHYPDTPEYQQYRAKYNTRVVARPWPSIDSTVQRLPRR
ncbi:MAG: VCBS repeat-containing protein [Acidobacteria bacterium]|nr:VCBS repeat-containing protein [Acidobacteriota bacterium]